MKKILTSSGIAFLVIFGLFSCSSPTQTVTVSIVDQQFVFDEPIYSGPNSSTITVEINLANENKSNIEIKKAKLKSAEISIADSTALNTNLNSLTLHISSASEPMTQIAVKNPLSSSSKENLTIAEDADLKNIISGKTFYLTLDADFLNDLEESFTLNGNFTFEISTN